MHLTTTVQEDAQYPTCLPVHCPKGERTCNSTSSGPDNTMILSCPHSTSLHLIICPHSELSSLIGRPGQVGRPAKALEYNNVETLLKKRNTTDIMVGGLTWQCCSGSRKSRVAKLPVVGLVAGLAHYVLTML